MSRSPYYRGLSIPQIETAANFSDAEFQSWVSRGASPAELDAIINPDAVVENFLLDNRKGQIKPTRDGFSLLANVETIPPYDDNSVTQDMWHKAIEKFRALYPQFVDCRENTQLFRQFLVANRDHFKQGIKPCVANVEAFFKTCFSRLYLRKVTKIVSEESVTRLNNRGKRVQAPPVFFPRAVKAELFEEILSPAQVQLLSADETTRMSNRMVFPETTTSATEHLQTDWFKSETPEPQSRSDQEQTEAQIKREVEIFKVSHPEFGRYLDDPDHYRGLYKIVLDRIGSWQLLINEASLLDAFKSIEADGILKSKDSDKGIQHGQVSTMKVTQDARRHWTKSEIAKEIRSMSASDFQRRLNEDADFRARVDSSR